jgi:hypothetical protein
VVADGVSVVTRSPEHAVTAIDTTDTRVMATTRRRGINMPKL